MNGVRGTVRANWLSAGTIVLTLLCCYGRLPEAKGQLSDRPRPSSGSIADYRGESSESGTMATSDLTGERPGTASVEMESPNDRGDRARPPKPTKQKVLDNYYPVDFLRRSETPTEPATETPSGPVPGDLQPGPPPGENGLPAPGEKEAEKAPARIWSMEKEGTLLALVVAGILFGAFVFMDYRYRTWLQTVLSQNERLLSPEASSRDFEGLTGTLEGLDASGTLFTEFPRIPHFINGTSSLDERGLSYSADSVSSLSSSLSNSYDGYYAAGTMTPAGTSPSGSGADGYLAHGTGAVS